MYFDFSGRGYTEILRFGHQLVARRLGSNAQQYKPQTRQIFNSKQPITFLILGLIGNMDMLGMTAQPTGRVGYEISAGAY